MRANIFGDQNLCLEKILAVTAGCYRLIHMGGILPKDREGEKRGQKHFFFFFSIEALNE